MIAEPQRRRSTAHFKATLIHRKAQKQTSTAAQLRILTNELCTLDRFFDCVGEMFGFLTSHSRWFLCIWIIRSWHTTVGVRNTCWFYNWCKFLRVKLMYFMFLDGFYLLVTILLPHCVAVCSSCFCFGCSACLHLGSCERAMCLLEARTVPIFLFSPGSGLSKDDMSKMIYDFVFIICE